MPRSTVNMLLAVIAAMASVPLYFLVGMVRDHSIIQLSPELPWAALSGLITSVMIGGCWALIWRGVVRWTRRRCVFTVCAVITSWLCIAGVMYVWTSERDHGDEEMFLPLVGVAVCLASLLFVWRETTPERRARLAAPGVACPVCGYDLSRLKQTTCPECGTAYTIEQLAKGRSE